MSDSFRLEPPSEGSTGAKAGVWFGPMRRMGWVAVVLLVALPAAGTGAPARKPVSRSAAPAPTAPAAPKRIANPPGLIAFYPRVAARVQKPPA